MATVYLARDLQSGARVAIKVLRPEIAPVLGTERFRREIRITAGLAHPNIIPVLDSGEVDHLPFYVTPYVAGETLADRLKRESQLPVDEAVTIACRITEALEAAHSEGFVHRDIKPSNILLAGDRVILADFGLARAVDVISAEQLTESGIVIGTPAYMSPEQSTSGARVDVRSDIYSLGCVIYEMLAGAPPSPGPRPSRCSRVTRWTQSPASERCAER
jgi:Serine/threonine protein kinase